MAEKDGIGAWLGKVLSRVFESAHGTATEIDQGLKNTVRVGADAAVTGVTENSGMSGNAARALGGRDAQLRALEDAAVGNVLKPPGQ